MSSRRFYYLSEVRFFVVRVADEARVRKAYFRMAQKYHPDKNPDGRVSQIYYTTKGLFSLKVMRF